MGPSGSGLDSVDLGRGIRRAATEARVRVASRARRPEDQVSLPKSLHPGELLSPHFPSHSYSHPHT